MRLLKDFEEFVAERIISKRVPDKARAKSLIEEAEQRKNFIDITFSANMDDANANYFVEMAYDTLIELLRAKLLLDGYYSSGEGAHEAEVSYMRKLGFTEKEVGQMNELRYLRNRITYYGRRFDEEYAQKIQKFLNYIYPELLKVVSN